jgi:iron complex transport system ATP-binding protein
LELLELLKVLTCKEELITVMVSHDLNLAMRYSDKMLILKDGKIFSSGIPSEVLTVDALREVYGIKAEITLIGKSAEICIVPISKY